MNILPDSRMKNPTGIKQCAWLNGAVINVVPFFCANCGKQGGFCPEENMTFLYWICDPCFEKLPPVDGTYVMPDEVFWKKVSDAQMEEYGHILSPTELSKELENPNSVASKLKKEFDNALHI